MNKSINQSTTKRLVETLRPFPGMRHLDVAGGTGDVALRVLSAITAAESEAAARAASDAPGAAPPDPGHVTVCDINGAMLAVGRDKAARAGLLGRTSWVQGDAERLPFPDGCMDAYTIAFGIRNVTDRAAALREARRVLRPGGRFLCLEFSQVGRGGSREAPCAGGRPRRGPACAPERARFFARFAAALALPPPAPSRAAPARLTPRRRRTPTNPPKPPGDGPAAAPGL